jgi:hypothetical protein
MHLVQPPGEKVYNDQEHDCGNENFDVSPYIRTECCKHSIQAFQHFVRVLDLREQGASGVGSQRCERELFNVEAVRDQDRFGAARGTATRE